MKHRNDLTKTESRRFCLILLHIAVAFGIAVGAFVAVSSDLEEMQSKWWLHQFFSPFYSGDTPAEVFGNTFALSAAYLTAAFFLGFFTLGQPLGVVLLICRGMGIGASVAAMYMLCGAKMLPAVMILVIPKAIALSFTAALSVREALRLSGMQFCFIFKAESNDDKPDRTLKLYFVKFIVLLIILIIISVLDSVLNYVFTNL
jgi:hypothetical protein